jgi:hypothetical protein
MQHLSFFIAFAGGEERRRRRRRTRTRTRDACSVCVCVCAVGAVCPFGGGDRADERVGVVEKTGERIDDDEAAAAQKKAMKKDYKVRQGGHCGGRSVGVRACVKKVVMKYVGEQAEGHHDSLAASRGKWLLGMVW